MKNKASLFDGRNMERIALLTVLFFLLPALSLLLPEPATAQSDTLRVFTYNIQHGRGLDDKVDLRRIAGVIKEKNPHLVTLQEVDMGVNRSDNINIINVLAGYLDMEPVFFKNISHQDGEYGNGILSSLPLISSRNQHFVQPEDAEQRGLLQTEVDFNGVTIAFMTTHLDNRSEPNRLAGVEQIIETKRAYRGSPVIVSGDFNALPDSPVHLRMKEYFFDVWEDVGEGVGYTIPPAAPNRRIDYFFYTNNLVEEDRPKIRAISMEVIHSEASDHLPIYAEFEVIR
ncbi:MAG: endonuclease/exonuclease/phosphatase family protein [Balneolales bacterium]